MRIQVLYDEAGEIIATSEIEAGEDAPTTQFLPLPGQNAATFDVPADCLEMSPAERHESLRVDIGSPRPTLATKTDWRSK